MLIPEHAAKVFDGINFDVYQWQQEEREGFTKTYECIRRTPGVQVIVVKDCKIMLSHERQFHSGWFYTPFGGLVDENESMLEAGKRELLEETGMECDDWYELVSFVNKDRVEINETVFVAKNPVRKQGYAWEPGEHIEITSVDFEGFIELLRRDDFRNKELALHILRMKDDERDSLKKLLFST